MSLLNITCRNSGMVRQKPVDGPYMVFEISLARSDFFLLVNKKRGLAEELSKVPETLWDDSMLAPTDVVETLENMSNYLGCAIVVDEDDRVVAYNQGDGASTAAKDFHVIPDDTNVYLDIYNFGSDKPSVEVRETRGGGLLPEDFNTHLEVLVDFLHDESGRPMGTGSHGLRELFHSPSEVVVTPTSIDSPSETQSESHAGVESSKCEIGLPRFYLDSLILVDRLKGVSHEPTVKEGGTEPGYYVVVDVENIGEVEVFISLLSLINNVRGS